ncbi:MAG: D-glycero-beta-D-manno-heptose-7-phosphate kinase [Verrucomicrobia bacterium]|nr:D-glycero-beta-D-manno-heptose-7-phosphate kinase [Verrucomicrobiota bacterium]
MVKLIGMLSRLGPVKVLVIGDFMLDAYTTGKIQRISPEAPVSVLNAHSEESRPGGAGNVVLNLCALGAKVIVAGRVGRDYAGEEIRSSLEHEGVDIRGLLYQKRYKTPVKNRFIADSQQLLRVDFETLTPLPEELEQELIQKLPDLMEECQIVAISDYGKSFLSNTLLGVVIEMAKAHHVPVIVDPKGIDFTKYRGATILKPNLAEAYAAARLPQDISLDEVAATVLKTCGVEQLMITRSQAGISLFKRSGERLDFPVRSKEVKDVTGAGDTVLSMLSVALANGLDIKYAAQLANIAAGMVIERIGCAQVSLSDMAERLMEFDEENKIFDGEHFFALQQSLKGKRCTVLSLEGNQGMSTAIFKSLRKLATKEPENKLVVYVRDRQPDKEFISLLSSLSDVDFIVIECASLKNLCDLIQPADVYAIEGGKLVDLETSPVNLTTV